MSALDVEKLKGILLKDNDYTEALSELIKINNIIKTTNPVYPKIKGDENKITEQLIETVFLDNPLVSDITLITNVKKSVILYYIFSLIVKALHKKYIFRLPSMLNLVTKGNNWKAPKDTGYLVFLDTGQNPSVSIYFIVGVYSGGQHPEKKLRLRTITSDYMIKENTIVISCLNESGFPIDKKINLNDLTMDTVFDLLQTMYDKN